MGQAKKIKGAAAVRLAAPSKLSRKRFSPSRFHLAAQPPLGFSRPPSETVKAPSFAVQVRGTTAVKLLRLLN